VGSLFALHQSGYVHRDIRLANILKFGDHVQLIDYGFACKKGEQSSQGLFDAMVQRAGPVFQQLHGRYGNSLQWHRTTDHEMLMRVLINREMKKVPCNRPW
jgi:serine/threonine protein kinase